ncbi:hypothetical protein ENBRE01_0807 [Enteropsectra breve]|nr:hypothetical protein ENBRE01_0807 [Enteropsectra breve]
MLKHILKHAHKNMALISNAVRLSITSSMLLNYQQNGAAQMSLRQELDDGREERTQRYEEAKELAESWIFGYFKRTFLDYECTRHTDAEYESYKRPSVYFHTDDGERLGAFLYKPKRKTDENTSFFVLCHGKGKDRIQTDESLEGLDELCEETNSVVLMVDYRGFGNSTGAFSIAGGNKDVLSAFNYLKKTYKAEQISLVGYSMGTAIALEYSKDAIAARNKKQCGIHEPHKIFCLAPFSSTIAICTDFMSFSCISFIYRSLKAEIESYLNYNSIANSRLVSDKLHIFHGDADVLIDIKHSREIHAASKCNFVISAHDHDTIFSDMEVWRKIIELNRV